MVMLAADPGGLRGSKCSDAGVVATRPGCNQHNNVQMFISLHIFNVYTSCIIRLLVGFRMYMQGKWW